MTDKKQEKERADRNQKRSEEAHWQVAEAGAEEEERRLKAPFQSDSRQNDWAQDDWENEGGAFAREPRQAIEQGYEKPVPTKRENFGNIKEVRGPERA